MSDNALDLVFADDELRELYHLLHQRKRVFTTLLEQIRTDQSAARQHGDVAKVTALQTILDSVTEGFTLPTAPDVVGFEILDEGS